jgi:transcriptional regulator with XRE-family HTH domain
MVVFCSYSNGATGVSHSVQSHITAEQYADVDLPNASDDQLQSQRTAEMERHVGLRIRERRIMMGISQQQLSHMIGVTYQQAHKYERGLNRISAGRLFEISKVLAVEPTWFFDGLSKSAEAYEPSPRERMALELARNFALIQDEAQQVALSQMARSLAMKS